jgi:hypothetical protein
MKVLENPGRDWLPSNYIKNAPYSKENSMSPSLILLIILIIVLIGAAPAWPHSRNWGYAPVGGLGAVLLILLVLILLRLI